MSSHPPGAILLPQRVAARGMMNWPKCAQCRRAVDAYGIENETDGSIEVWAECRGVRLDPATGRAVHGSVPLHPRQRSSVTILKGPGWSRNRFAEIISRQAFFAPAGEGERRFVQTIAFDGVRPR